MTTAKREPNQGDIAAFVGALFQHADEGTYVSLRTFEQSGRGPARFIRGVQINGEGLKPVISEAVTGARFAANATTALVFAPPVATFRCAYKATEVNLANGVVIGVELDEGNTTRARKRLEGLLGRTTVVVASGGEWADPATGEVFAKLHLYWRLSEPTRDTDDHAKLKLARSFACALVDADPTGRSCVHPMRWAGSWHLKATPKLARLIALNEAAEVHLPEALEALETAAEQAGLLEFELPRPNGSSTPQAPLGLVESALAALPNAAEHWDTWIKIGLLLYRATGAGAEGLDAWITWSAKSSKKFVAGACEERWAHFATSPPTRGGAGTLFMLAKAAGWKRPDPQPIEAPDGPPPGPEDDPGYQAAQEAAAASGGADTDAIDAVIDRFNDKYLMVNESGKAVIYQPGYDPVLKRRHFDRLSSRDLATLYMNERILAGVDDKGRRVYETAANIWLRHPNRKQFIGGVTFDPSQRATPDVLNLWEGFAVKPAPGDWLLMRDHIRNIICDGDPVRFDYLTRWMARMVQFPAEQGEVAVVMQGGEGTGKGTLAKALMHLTGHHGLAISNGRHLTGNFNGHLRDVIFLFADEALFAGDRQHIGALKSLISEPYLTIEAKFANAVQAPNYLHVMMASNETWVVPAAQDARRYFVLVISEAMKGNHDYFAAIWDQMKAGGYEAMLHDLLHIDLTSFNVRNVPITEGLQQQKKLSLDTSNSWWFEVLHRGYVFRSKLGLEDFFSKWHDEVATELLYASYTEFAGKRRERHPLGRESFGRFMVSLGHTLTRPRNLTVGERIADVPNAFGNTTRTAEQIIHPRSFAYRLGTLAAARAAFVDVTGLAIEWPQDDDQDPFA